MGGGIIAIAPAEDELASQDNAIVGNTVLYGATGGHLFAAGRAGQRFAVRNSGATAVVEGVGEHACEYMTGGIVVVLGRVGRNFGAGMTGGHAYIYDADGASSRKINTELVEAVDSFDDKELKKLIKRHQEETGSAWAKYLLQHWKTTRKNFLRVAPKAQAATIEAKNEGVVR